MTLFVIVLSLIVAAVIFKIRGELKGKPATETALGELGPSKGFGRTIAGTAFFATAFLLAHSAVGSNRSEDLLAAVVIAAVTTSFLVVPLQLRTMGAIILRLGRKAFGPMLFSGVLLGVGGLLQILRPDSSQRWTSWFWIGWGFWSIWTWYLGASIRNGGVVTAGVAFPWEKIDLWYWRTGKHNWLVDWSTTLVLRRDRMAAHHWLRLQKPEIAIPVSPDLKDEIERVMKEKTGQSASVEPTTGSRGPARSRIDVASVELVRRIGAGAMGEIWEGRLGENQVAVKMIPEYLAGDDALVERLKREADAMSRLDHPNVVAILGFGEIDGRSALVEEMLEGETLAARLEREHPLPFDEIERIAVAVGEALAYIHSRGIVHRDLKPQNIFVTGGGVIKLIDLGVAKVLDEASLTVTGSHFGTPAYMSPESFRDSKSVLPSADLWSLGVILYECATGQLPFAGRTAASIIAKIADTNVTPQSPTLTRPELPAPLASIIERCLAREAALRPSGEELVEKLAGRKVRIPIETGKPRFFKRKSLGIAIMILLIAGPGIATFIYYKWIHDPMGWGAESDPASVTASIKAEAGAILAESHYAAGRAILNHANPTTDELQTALIEFDKAIEIDQVPGIGPSATARLSELMTVK